MELALYSRSRENCKVDTSKEAVTTRVVLMYANRFSISNFFSETVLLWRGREEWDEMFYVSMFETIYCHDEPGGNNEPGSCFAVLDEARQLRHIKHKDKVMLVLHQKLESILKSVRADVTRWFEYYMDLHRMKPMLPFIDEEVFVPMEGTDFLNDSEGDDPMIKDIIESFTHYEENLVFDQLIESLVPFKRMDKEAGTNESVEEPYFVSMPLFEFPYIIDINYPQLAHIRGELMQALEVFHDDFENSNTELRSMLYKTDKEKIQHYLHKFISPHLEEIQKAIDKNVYIQQEKNRYRSDQRIKVMMGVTSYENQIRLLEKEEIIQPYIADSIIEKLAKNFDVRCCTPFIYHIYPENIITQ